MPQLIQHIDAIARQKQRDVLTVEFDFSNPSFKAHWLTNEARKTVCDWLDANHIPYYPCGPFANDEKLRGYRGQIYIDIPCDVNDSAFRKVQGFLENPNDSMRLEGTKLKCYSLELRMQNAYHDEPEFLDKLTADL